MKKLFKYLLPAIGLTMAASAFASSSDDFFFYRDIALQERCIADKKFKLNSECLNKNGKRVLLLQNESARFRILNASKDSSAKFGISISRPFFIIDGIHLSTSEARTLSDFERETNEFGIPEMLTNLGYTPILVQFSQTVRTSLQSNSIYFQHILEMLGEGKLISFPNKKKEGFIVLGISQGGIIGRYGAYLYDKSRSKNDTPIRLFASLDSPHQGAVMPRGLVSTIDFWANEKDVASAEAFYDLITAPGARDLLLYNTKEGNNTYEIKTDTERFLFGDYRNAANYKNFPSVLISQGQMKGSSPKHESHYFILNREATRSGEPYGRAQSMMAPSTAAKDTFSFNRVYEFLGDWPEKTLKGDASFDFVQGSTYPFSKTIYDALKEGMEEAIPEGMEHKIKLGFITLKTLKFNTKWHTDKFYEGSSTFIPTASALDLQCNGKLSVNSDCAFKASYKDIDFENPGKSSTANSAYAVDPTHPRYAEAISGRHIESPVKSDGSIDSTVLKGMQTDIWRVLCEVAKLDYDSTQKQFRNPMLTGMFSPTTSCMDRSKIPDVIANSGKIQTKNFGYIRYDYNKDASESNANVSFTLPSGWQRVALVDNGKDVPEGSFFEMDIKVENPKNNWMKAELLLTQGKNGGGQVQLSEQKVIQDGNFHTIRWQMPTVKGAMSKYRWFRVVLNSNGANVTMTKPRLLTSSVTFEEKPEAIKNASIYPSNYGITKWSESSTMKEKTVNGSNVLEIAFKERYDGIHLDLGGLVNLDKYKNLKVEYVPSTCEASEIYFDSQSHGKVNLDNGSLQNGFMYKILQLKEIINTNVTPGNSLSASRLTLQALRTDEKCSIKSIILQ